MIDYDLKSQILKIELDVLQRQVSKSLYFHDFPNQEIECFLCYHLALEIECFYRTCYSDLWEEAEKINHARYERVRRLKHYISRLLNYGNAQFLTFTFNKHSLDNLSASTRKTYVTRFLKKLDTLYVANIDFGKINEREHFHAVCCSDYVDYTSWNYGALNGQLVRTVEDSPALSKYISKLTNHAIKETTKRSSMIYSRLTFDEYERKQKVKNISFDEVSCDVLPFSDEYYQDELF